MHKNTTDLLEKGKERVSDALAPEKVVKEVTEANAAIQGMNAHILEMINDHGLVQALEDDDDVRGTVNELGVKLNGMLRLGQEVMQKNLDYLTDLRRLRVLVTNVDNNCKAIVEARRIAALSEVEPVEEPREIIP